jgi:hypothetical protein
MNFTFQCIHGDVTDEAVKSTGLRNVIATAALSLCLITGCATAPHSTRPEKANPVPLWSRVGTTLEHVAKGIVEYSPVQDIKASATFLPTVSVNLTIDFWPDALAQLFKPVTVTMEP